MIDIYLLYNVFNKLNEHYDKSSDKKNNVHYDICSFTILIIAVLIFNNCNNDNPFEIFFVVFTPILYIIYYILYNHTCRITKENINKLSPVINDVTQKGGGFYSTVISDTMNSTISSIHY
jgi:hypothetical protein